MIAGMSGSLVSHDAIEQLIASGQEPELAPARWLPLQRRLRVWHAEIRHRLGPTAGPRTVFDLVAGPLASTLGFVVLPVSAGRGAGRTETIDAELRWEGRPLAVIVASAWGHPPRNLWRHSVHRALAHSVRWALCINGPSVCLFDAERTYSRRFLQFDLQATFASDRGITVLCGLLGAQGLAPVSNGAALERVMTRSERHRAMVRRSLRTGVSEAVVQMVSAFRGIPAGRTPDSDARLLDESLIVVYRLLFLLFAEARGLVPNWHPVYRDSYSLGSIRREMSRGMPCGLWETLQALARLAHRGCTAGTLKVPPFNGRLFSPAQAPLADSVRLDDRAVATVVQALTTRVEGGKREEIAYGDLGVEQLGGVYEHLLDFDLATTAAGTKTMVPTGRRKATGSFYTPRQLTEFIVRRVLGPIVERSTPEEILALRILDPAMGSGAFLVAACRYLASAYEAALVREGAFGPSDISETDRADFRRAIAQRCLYGVDMNPMAVQLARLSLWLATLAADKPLTFLDHRLRVGNSLIGASIDDLAREPGARRMQKPRDLPLFPGEELQFTLRTAVGVRRALAEVPDDSLEQVRAKERELASLDRAGGPLEKWRACADLWCAAWLDERGREKGVFGALRDHVTTGAGALPPHVAGPLVTRLAGVAAKERAFHWTMEFPEVFWDGSGEPLADAGFDVILGNPPWEMLRGGGHERNGLTAFVKGSGHYRLQGDGHANLYQLFVERGLWLLRREGSAGLILPAGFASDHGSSVLRRHVFDRTAVRTFTTVDNADGLFPIHRGLRFLLLTFSTPGRTADVLLRSGVRFVDALERVADCGADPEALKVPRTLIERVGGESMAVPELRTEADLRIVSAISLGIPALSDVEGWGAQFGRELNATDDRPHFNECGSGMPVIEGKQLVPFRTEVNRAKYWIRPAVAATLVDADRTFSRARLAYRDVASPSNRQTLIAAIVPPGTLTTHTLFCLKTAVDEEAQWFLCGVLNSYVANYLVRMRVSTHVTAAIVSRLPVPRPARSDPRFAGVVKASRALAHEEDAERLAGLNAAVASLYDLTAGDFEHIVGTFPLIPLAERSLALRRFARDGSGASGYHFLFP
jgi:N-6 DNA Methylase/Eco57I restriction-modification methylase